MYAATPNIAIRPATSSTNVKFSDGFMFFTTFPVNYDGALAFNLSFENDVEGIGFRGLGFMLMLRALAFVDVQSIGFRNLS